MTEKEQKIKCLRKVESKLSSLSDNSKDIDKLRDLLYDEMLDEKKSKKPYNFYAIKLQEVINGTFKKLKSSNKKNKKEELKACIDDFKYYIGRYIDHINQESSYSSNNGEPTE